MASRSEERSLAMPNIVKPQPMPLIVDPPAHLPLQKAREFGQRQPCRCGLKATFGNCCAGPQKGRGMKRQRTRTPDPRGASERTVDAGK
jgi:hypothetical protein